MRSRVSLPILVLLLITSTIPLHSQAGDAGGVQASAEQVSFLPANPTQGGQVEISLALWNDNSAPAYDVYWTFMKESMNGAVIDGNKIDISEKSPETVSATWTGLSAGTNTVWIKIEYNGNNFYIDKEFEVSGLPDLRIGQVSMTPESGINSGELVQLEVEVRNDGSENAGNSSIGVFVGGQTTQAPVPALNSGETTTVYHNITAPETGTSDIIIYPDYNEEVIEAVENDKSKEVELIVSPRVDFYHKQAPTITSGNDDLDGPWTIEGVLMRSNGTGTDDVEMRFEIPDGSGGHLSIAPFTVQISGESQLAQKSWSQQLDSSDISGLDVGEHIIDVVIDPFSTGPVQESTENDIALVSFLLSPIPDVVLDEFARPLSTNVQAGDSVTWEITIANTGNHQVKGVVEYNWEGNQDTTSLINLQPQESFTLQLELHTSAGAHTATLAAAWIASSDSWDSISTNSVASGSIDVIAPLRLQWTSGISLTDSSGQATNGSLESGQEYTYSISVSSTEIGEEKFFCKNSQNQVIDSVWVNVTEQGQGGIVTCTFNATHPMTTLMLVPEHSSTIPIKTVTIDTKSAQGEGTSDKQESSIGTATLIGLVALGMIGVLVAAIILTREREEEVERDIFDYCPACDGELEGEEDRCPHCSFNLKKARKQFHDCESCKESIPDLLSNCPYCGAVQDVSKYFEQRQRKVVEKQTVSLPEEEEVDEDEIVSGTADFDEAITEFGYDAEQLETEWDEKLATAEAEVEAAYDKRMAALAEEVPEDEETQLQTIPTLKKPEEMGPEHDIDEILASKGEIRAHKDDGSDDLSASDAQIRGRLYELTGEKGVMPGDEVQIGMGFVDKSIAGNELPEEAADFSFKDEPLQPSIETVQEVEEKRPVTKRRAPKRGSNRKAECGACGASMPVDAKGCSTCGARFE